MKRREVLIATGATCSALIAGCVTGDGADEDNGDPEESPNDREDDEQNQAADPDTESETGTENDDEVAKETDCTEHEETDGADDMENGQGDTNTDDSSGNDSDPDGDENSGGDATVPEVTNAEVETTDSSCGGGVSHTDWQVNGNTVELTGTFEASTPCNAVVIVDVELQDGSLDVTLGTEATARECMQCIASIRYTATIEVSDGSRIEDVTIAHPDSG